jgi:glyoxylase-like metal-dependent hydrolase (beta-lactamase superfamily II)
VPAEVAPGVFVFTARAYTTTTTVVAGEGGGCLVIDPAVSVGDLTALASWLSGRGLRPVAGWSTHPHWDHVLWSAALGADVPRYATRAAAAVAERERDGLTQAVAESSPGHDLSLFASLTALDGERVPWDGPSALVVGHDAHAPGHGAVFLPASGVLIAGDMCSDIEIPLPDMESADPFGGYRTGLGRLARVRGVRIVVPGHGHVGDTAAFRARVAADYAYLDAVETGADASDPRLAGEEWLRDEHARHVAAVTPSCPPRRSSPARTSE